MRREIVPAMLLAGAALCAPPPALAQAQSTPPAAAAAEGVEYLVGRWTATAEDPQTGEKLLIDYQVAPGVGPWLHGRGVSRDGAFSSSDVWGRDPLTREIVRVVFDGSGALATIRSPGWQGDRLVLEGDVRSAGGTLRVRETITRLGRDRFRAVWEAHRNGAWVAYSIEMLTRQG